MSSFHASKSCRQPLESSLAPRPKPQSRRRKLESQKRHSRKQQGTLALFIWIGFVSPASGKRRYKVLCSRSLAITLLWFADIPLFLNPSCSLELEISSRNVLMSTLRMTPSPSHDCLTSNFSEYADVIFNSAAGWV